MAYLSDVLDVEDHSSARDAPDVNGKKKARKKIIVFGHHQSMLDAVEALCVRKKMKHIRIDGQTPLQVRHSYVQKFEADPTMRVAVLSMTAAGQGLTLTSASTVIFAELHWTPGVIQQVCASSPLDTHGYGGWTDFVTSAIPRHLRHSVLSALLGVNCVEAGVHIFVCLLDLHLLSASHTQWNSWRKNAVFQSSISSVISLLLVPGIYFMLLLVTPRLLLG